MSISGQNFYGQSSNCEFMQIDNNLDNNNIETSGVSHLAKGNWKYLT